MEHVRNRADFIRFLEGLESDLGKRVPETNLTLPAFLGAMTAYANDVQGYYDNRQENVNADEPSWQVFADILRGATMYE